MGSHNSKEGGNEGKGASNQKMENNKPSNV